MGLNECDDSAMTSENNKDRGNDAYETGEHNGDTSGGTKGREPMRVLLNLPSGPSTPASTPANKLGFIENRVAVSLG